VSGDVRERAARIKLLVLDVDGVLTDGRVVYDAAGGEIKFFDVRDGHGLKLWQRAGHGLIWLSGRGCQANRVRAQELGVDQLIEQSKVKLPVFLDVIAQRGLEPSQVAYMGDDLIDLPPMRVAGLAMAPADADPEAVRAAHWVADKPGGRGAVRQAVELILKAQGRWAEVTARYY